MNNTTANTNLTTMTPKEIDELLLGLYREQFNLAHDLEMAMYRATDGGYYDTNTDLVVRRVHEAVEVMKFGYKSVNYEAFYVLQSHYEASPCEISEHGGHEMRLDIRGRALLPVTLEFLTTKRLDDKTALGIVLAEDNSVLGQKVRDVVARQNEVRALINAIDDEYEARGRWSRFFLVTSSNGHIHSSTTCHTCNKGKNATTFALVYHLSGERADRAVEVFGPALCSVCFPDAPVEMTEQAKVTTSLANVYYEQGYEGWLAAKAKADARKAKREAARV